VSALSPWEVASAVGGLLLGSGTAVRLINTSWPWRAARRGRHSSVRMNRTAEREESRWVRQSRRSAYQMDHAADLIHMQQIAADAERLIREENADWFGVIRFHDIELIT
jgi:heme/copper-type cytochrome/quinol oxidase subunit 1